MGVEINAGLIQDQSGGHVNILSKSLTPVRQNS